MSRLVDRVLRAALWTSVPVNLLGVGLFTAAAIGYTSPLLPFAPPPFYAAQLALIIGLFGGVYAWLALQPQINRPLLAVGTAGKLGFFMLFVVFWGAGDLGLSHVGTALPDLILGLIFLNWFRAPAWAPSETRRIPDGLPANRFIVKPLSEPNPGRRYSRRDDQR